MPGTKGTKKKEQKFELKQTTDEKLVFYKAIKEVKRVGNSGHVVLPKEMIGREVKIVWGEEK